LFAGLDGMLPVAVVIGAGGIRRGYTFLGVVFLEGKGTEVLRGCGEGEQCQKQRESPLPMETKRYGMWIGF
jgi:hypothetical protein